MLRRSRGCPKDKLFVNSSRMPEVAFLSTILPIRPAALRDSGKTEMKRRVAQGTWKERDCRKKGRGKMTQKELKLMGYCAWRRRVSIILNEVTPDELDEQSL